jgi:hypothetical protein
MFKDVSVVVNGAVNRIEVEPAPIDAVGAAKADDVA